MEDYYSILGLNHDASLDAITDAYKNKKIEFKMLPFLTPIDKELKRKIKKAYAIFTNPKYKKIYDNYLQTKFKNELVNYDDTKLSKKTSLKQDYLVDRIFSFNSSHTNYNLKHNELLRPKNVGLSSDNTDEFEHIKKNNNDFKPYNFDS
jgi:curved DNA-binding protein CbpA